MVNRTVISSWIECSCARAAMFEATGEIGAIFARCQNAPI